DGFNVEDQYQLHPALLDAAFHVLIAATDQPGAGYGAGNGTYVVASIERVQLHSKPGRRFWSHATFRRSDPEAIDATIELIDEGGQVAATVTGLRCIRVKESFAANRPGQEVDDWIYDVRWEEKPLGPPVARQRAPVPTPLQVL